MTHFEKNANKIFNSQNFCVKFFSRYSSIFFLKEDAKIFKSSYIGIFFRNVV